MSFIIPSTKNRTVAILGAGVIGRRIGACWAAGGYRVNLHDPSEEQLKATLGYIKSESVKYPGKCRTCDLKIQVFHDLKAAVADAFLVIECVPEVLELKQETFIELEHLAPPDAILATNSSSYKSREVASRLQTETRKRVLNLHYTMPPTHLVVELMTCGDTQTDIFPFLVEMLREVGMKPIVAHKESTGFVCNRVWAAIKRECLMILAEGVSTPEELDAAWTNIVLNSSNGPCFAMDEVGLDTVAHIEEHYIEERGLQDSGVIPLLRKYVNEGKLGAKSSLGGLYPPGAIVKTTEQHKRDIDNSNAPKLYFLDIGLSNKPEEILFSGRVLVGSADGEAPLRTIVDHQNFPDGIALARSAGLIFWTNMGIPFKNDGSILNCRMDGSDIRTVVPEGNVHTPKQIAIDEANGKIYFSDREGMRVMRCNFDGSGLEILVQTGDWTQGFDDQTKWCIGITVAPREGKFYWTQKGPPKGSRGQLCRASIDFPAGMDAKNRQDIECLFHNMPEPVDLEVDEQGGFLYWTDRGEMPWGNSINRARIDGIENGEYDILARNLHEAIGLAIDKKNRHIYATDLGGSVYRFDMDGGNKKRFYDGQGSFSGIVLAYD